MLPGLNRPSLWLNRTRSLTGIIFHKADHGLGQLGAMMMQSTLSSRTYFKICPILPNGPLM